jgi:hypothetical protein
MAIAFDQPNKTVSISVLGYVKKMLQRFRPQYLLPGHHHHRTPGVYIAPSFNKKPKTVFIDRSEKLSPALVTELQAIIGTLLYYARAVDPTLLPISNELAPQQANATRRVLNAPSVTAPPTAPTRSSITHTTWYYTCLPMPHTCAGLTHNPSPELSSSLGTTTIQPESTMRSTSSALSYLA